MAEKAQQLERQVWELDGYGFNILHDPQDDSPCVIEEGLCKNLDHLFPIAKGKGTN